MAAERLGEGHLDELFNYNQFLSAGNLGSSFLTAADETGTYMIATWRVDAVLCMILFFVLVFSLLSAKRRDGDLWIRFMTLGGAGGVLAESLRTDDFLVYSFVRIEQVLAALMLLGGIIAAGRMAGRTGRKLFFTAVVTMVLTVSECIGIEFAADRTQMNRWLLTGVMAAALCIPVIQVGYLQRNTDADREKTVGKAAWTALIISAAETVFIAAEILRIGVSGPFPLVVLISAALITVFHLVILLKSDWRSFLRLSKDVKEN